VFILSNPDLGVYEQEFNVPEPGRGRYLILIHSGNSSEDVVGCIAPGMSGDGVEFSKGHGFYHGTAGRL
jgi:hypothetical protein